MSYIPRSRVVEPLSDGSITLLILPEQPAIIMPIRVWCNGQRMAASDYTTDGDALTIMGDFAEDAFEVDYYVAVASFVPRTARLQGVATATTTVLTLPELPVDSLPITIHMGGMRMSLLDYTVDGAVITLRDEWGGWFDVDYYISAIVGGAIHAPEPDPDDNDGGDSDDNTSTTKPSGMESYIDPFSENLVPLSLPLPEAYTRVMATTALYSLDDHVIVRVSSHSWEDFYKRLLKAALAHPEFLDTAVNVQQRFGFTSSPAPDLPEVAVIRAGESYAPIGDWMGRYDQVYTAVLVMRFAAGTVPEELIS